MHNAQMKAAYTSINRAIAIVVALTECHEQMAEGDVENLLFQVNSHLYDASSELEAQNSSNEPAVDQQPGSELEERVGALLNFTGMAECMIDTRLSAYDEARDTDHQLWSLMGFLNKNILGEIKKIQLGGGNKCQQLLQTKRNSFQLKSWKNGITKSKKLFRGCALLLTQ